MKQSMISRRTSKSAMTKFLKCCVDFGKAEDGVVAMILALMLIPLMIATGLAIDIGRGYIVKQRLAHTTDAAGLAIGSAIGTNTTSADMQIVFDRFFTANFPEDALGTITGKSFTFDGRTIRVTASADVETTFMKIANIDTLTVNAVSEITRKEETLEVVLVLDNTGSMRNNGKITDLKNAANSLVKILFGRGDTSSQVKIGMVPFAGSVNIGRSNRSLVTNTFRWRGCVKALASPGDVEDNFAGPWDPFNRSCPSAITPLTNVKSTLTAAISAMNASGITHVNYGAIWGLRAISPDAPFTEGAAYGGADATKAVIILTDGANTINRFSSAYRDFASLPSSSDLDDKLLEVCDAMKNEGIAVYTITFDLNDSTTQRLFRDCATDAGKYFNSPGGSELTRVFRAIAAELKQLRVSL